MQFLGFLGGPLGYVMEFIYKFIVSDYGLSLVLFTIVLRVLMFPLRIKQQKSTAKMSAYQPMILEIQKKYAKDKNKQQEELMKLQEEYGYSPTAGCLPMVLNFVVIFGIIEVVYRPLTYILHLPAEVITAAADAGSIAAGYDMGSSIVKSKDAVLILIMALAFVANYFFAVNVIYIILIVIVIGLVRTLIRERRKGARG